MVQPIPEGCHSVIPHLVVRNANEAIDFYVRAFGAKELGRWPSPDGKHVLHASIQIGDSMVMLCDELPQMKRWLAPQSLGGTSVALQLWSEDADAAFRRAVKAGAKVSLPLADMYWGARYGRVVDPFGHEWAIATRIRDVSLDEMATAAETAFTGKVGEK
jgi:uncharacterized glyoxalase superfamily protein PhnB